MEECRNRKTRNPLVLMIRNSFLESCVECSQRFSVIISQEYLDTEQTNNKNLN